MAKKDQGTYFIAYKGKHVDPINIRRFMETMAKKDEGCFEKVKIIQKNKDTSVPDYKYFPGETDLLYFGKIVPGNNSENREPYFYSFAGEQLITVSGYNQERLEDLYKRSYKNRYDITEPSFYHSLFNRLIADNDIEGLMELRSKALWFSTVFYYQCGKDESLTGYVSGSNDKYSHLYFGYPSLDHLDEVMFSNSTNIIEEFCTEWYELGDNCYIADGKAYDSNRNRIPLKDAVVLGLLSMNSGKVAIEKDLADFNAGNSNLSNNTTTNNPSNNTTNSPSSPSIAEERAARIEAAREERARLAREAEEASRQQANNFSSTLGIRSIPRTNQGGSTGTNSSSNSGRIIKPIQLDSSYADESKRELERKTLAMLMPLILSDESKKKLREFIEKDLNTATKEEIERVIGEVIDQYNIDDYVKEKITQIIDEIVEEYTNKIQVPKVNIININNVEVGRVEGEHFHCRYNDILSSVVLKEPLLLVGPAGCGKNHTISQVSKGLGLDMHYTNCATNEFKLTGFIDASGTYRETEFYKAFKNGGLFFLDEIDTSDPASLIVLNSALANGYMPYPHEVVNMHPDFRMVAAANTYCNGGDIQYVGRNALDVSTLDRFDVLPFEYDRDLERILYPDEQVLAFMWALRDALKVTDIKHIVSTRGIGKLYKKAVNNVPIELALQTAVVKTLKREDLDVLLKAMNIDHDNIYYKAAKTLKINR